MSELLPGGVRGGIAHESRKLKKSESATVGNKATSPQIVYGDKAAARLTLVFTYYDYKPACCHGKYDSHRQTSGVV